MTIHEADKAGRGGWPDPLPYGASISDGNSSVRPLDRKPTTLNIERRRARERAKSIGLQSKGGDSIRRIAELSLSVSGLRRAGRKRALDLRLKTHTLAIAGLPRAFHGLRVLQISDVHYPETRDAEFEAGIIKLTQDTKHDLCVLTGDYRDRSFGPADGAIKALTELRPVLANDVLAVLGNHDSLDIVAPMQQLGIEVLMNEHHKLTRGKDSLIIAGIDDPSYFRTDEVSTALATDGPTILLAHSPERYREAADAGADAYLCGHTHGGQICLPGGYALRRNANVPRAMVGGAWQYGAMSGYTSRGAGTSIINARFFCPPELTLHVLQAVALSQ